MQSDFLSWINEKEIYDSFMFRKNNPPVSGLFSNLLWSPKMQFFDLTASSRKYSMDAFRLRCNHIYRIWSSGSICLHLNTWLVEFAQMISNWFRLLILYYAKVISNHIKWSPAPQSLINSYSDYLELILPLFNLAKVNIAEFVQ